MEKDQSKLTGPPPLPKPPTIFDGFVQPGFPLAKVFTCFFLRDCLVFVKTGSLSTNMGGSIRTSLGGFTGDALILGAMGSIADQHNRENRMEKAASVASWNAEQMVAAHRRNFMLRFSEIEIIRLKGPNFAGELRVIIESGKSYKFRLNNQSKNSVAYLEKVFNEFLPGKILRK